MKSFAPLSTIEFVSPYCLGRRNLIRFLSKYAYYGYCTTRRPGCWHKSVPVQLNAQLSLRTVVSQIHWYVRTSKHVLKLWSPNRGQRVCQRRREWKIRKFISITNGLHSQSLHESTKMSDGNHSEDTFISSAMVVVVARSCFLKHHF
jgi:hypothetical protein